jgi:hypothetical protein
MTPQELFDARDRGDRVEVLSDVGAWFKWDGCIWDISREYRIAPKKEKSLVEELRNMESTKVSEWLDLTARAADRITDLEALYASSISAFTTDELLAEIKRRME